MTNFERFYITWYSRAIYFAREYVLSESDAENIVQDVFLHLYEHCDRLDAYTNLTAYLFFHQKQMPGLLPQTGERTGDCRRSVLLLQSCHQKTPDTTIRNLSNRKRQILTINKNTFKRFI